jgi:hypothetical protein
MSNAYATRIGSATFGTSVMKTEEAFLYVKSAIEGGADLETAHDDMRMIDDILHLKQIHSVVHGSIKRTKAGHLRKGTSLYDAINDLIGARVEFEKSS